MRNNRKARHAGFTLVEIVIVIVILAILAAIILPRFVGRTEDARISSASTQISTFKSALNMCDADTGAFPATLDGLISNPGMTRWKGPYLQNTDKVPLDPWEHPYIYKHPGASGNDYDIISGGPDGQIGTPDDIKN